MKAPRRFILDAAEYQAAVTVLPKDEQRAKLQKALDRAYRAYRELLTRQGSLAAEIDSLSRELARRNEPELAARLSTLFAIREASPALLAEAARAFAGALAAWARVTARAFERVGHDSVNAVEATLAERNALAARMDDMRLSETERQAARDALSFIMAGDRPHRDAIAAAQEGRALVIGELRHYFGDYITGPGDITEAHIDAFASRHRARTGVAA